VAGTVADTSVLIPYLGGADNELLERAINDETLILPPMVVSELISGAQSPGDRLTIGELLQETPLHPTPLEHWIAVGELRRQLRRRGLEVSTPDAHIAQCALDRDAVLLTHDTIFRRIARHIPLRLTAE
jgi:predicted nucleic acid-binding protein